MQEVLNRRLVRDRFALFGHYDAGHGAPADDTCDLFLARGVRLIVVRAIRFERLVRARDVPTVGEHIRFKRNSKFGAQTESFGRALVSNFEPAKAV